MDQIMFITETKNQLTQKHHMALRNLYLPIIGMEATTLYSILNDYNYMNRNNPSYMKLEDIAKTMRISLTEVLVAKTKLEAVGLIRTFQKSDDTHFVFVLNPPLEPVAFKKNVTLYSQAIKQIGDLIFERVYFSTKELMVKKDDFKEVTVKYHDVFDVVADNQTTLEIPIVKFKNKQEAIKGLTTPQFVKFLTTEKVTPSQLALFQRLQNSGLSSWSLNEIVDYTYEINGKVVSAHIETIANDLISKSITNPEDIRTEMENAKKGSKPTESNIVKPQENISSKADDMAWTDIFESLGGEL